MASEYAFDSSYFVDPQADAENVHFNAEQGAEAQRTWRIVIFMIICIVGLIGNLITIFVIFILKEYQKSVTHWYVLQLAIADSVFLLTLPFKISEDIHDQWIFSEWMCKAKETLLFLNYYTSILFLMVMSIDRYIAVCHPFSSILQKFRSKEAASIITVVMWITGLLLCIPVMMFSFKTGLYPRCRCSYEFPAPLLDANFNCVESGFKSNQTIAACLEFFSKNANLPKEDMYCKPPNPDIIDALFNEHSNKVGNTLFSEYPNKAGDALFNDTLLFNEYPNKAGDALFNDTLFNEYPNKDGGVLFYPDEYPLFDYNDTNLQHKLTISSTVSKNVIHKDCHYWSHPVGWHAFIIFNFTAMFIAPFLIMVVCYGLILRRVSNSNVRTSRYPSSSSASRMMSTSSNISTTKRTRASSKSDRDRIRMTVMCATLVSAFVVCWLPFHAIHLAKIVGIPVPLTQGHICLILPIIGSILAYVNSALNPYLYSFLGTKFTKRWRNAINKSFGRRGSTSSSVFGSVRFAKAKGREGSSSTTPATSNKYNRNNITENNYLPSEAPVTLAMTKDPKIEEQHLNPARDEEARKGEANATTGETDAFIG